MESFQRANQAAKTRPRVLNPEDQNDGGPFRAAQHSYADKYITATGDRRKRNAIFRSTMKFPCVDMDLSISLELFDDSV